MKIVGIVPARGGSKRLPRKNTADLGGKPLLQWTLDAARESGIFDKVWVSSEDYEIGSIAHILWPNCWWRRSPKLALDDTPSRDVVAEIAEFYKEEDVIYVLLQPTSPFRSVIDIQKSLELLGNGDSVISVCEASQDFVFELGFVKRLRNLPDIRVPNGALYLITSDALNRGESWYSGIVYGYEMPKQRSLDIDTEQDLILARYIAESKLY